MKNIRYICLILALFISSILNATVLGPIIITQNVPIPNDMGKVVVYSTPHYMGGVLILTETSTGQVAHINGSVTYIPVWYYILPQGNWAVSYLSANRNAMINGVSVSVGDEVTIGPITTIVFTPTNDM